jgi:hypothetical protein
MAARREPVGLIPNGARAFLASKVVAVKPKARR